MVTASLTLNLTIAYNFYSNFLSMYICMHIYVSVYKFVCSHMFVFAKVLDLLLRSHFPDMTALRKFINLLSIQFRIWVFSWLVLLGRL